MHDSRAMTGGLAVAGVLLLSMFLPAGAHATASPDPIDAPAKQPSVRAICPDYARALAGSTYPRDAIARGLDAGEAVVEFVVDQGRVEQIDVVSASDPAFGAAASAIVARLACERTDAPVHFRLPFKFRRG